MISQIIGFIGMMFVVYAYHKVTTDGWKSSDTIFNVVNLIGAIFLIISLFFHFNFGSFMIEIFWIVIAVKALHKKFKTKKV